MTFIQTWSGKKFDFENFGPDDVTIEDIAHHLSLINRFGGAARFPYSVAQHSVYVAREVARRGEGSYVIANALMHDAAETYIGDWPKHLKEMLGWQICHLEDKCHDAINKRFDIFLYNWPDDNVIKQVDHDLLETEFRDVVGKRFGGSRIYGTPLSHMTITPWSPQQAEETFLILADMYVVKHERPND